MSNLHHPSRFIDRSDRLPGCDLHPHHRGDGRSPIIEEQLTSRSSLLPSSHLSRLRGYDHYDVIIAGASYGGLAAAIALRGRRVLLIDRHPVGAHQTSACGTLLAVVEALGLEHTLRQVHHRFVVHFPRRRFEFPLAYPFCTFDHAPFCQALRQRTDAEFVQATVYGRDGDTVITDQGAFQGDILIDASGWGAVLTEGRASRVARGDMSFGLETEIPAPPTEGLHFWYEPGRLVPRGVTWLFPCGETSRFGIGSYAGNTRLKAGLAHFLDTDFGLTPGVIHGTYWPYGVRPASTDGVFRVGDAAGHCLPFTGEGIRPALYFGLACGQIVRQVLDGEHSPSLRLGPSSSSGGTSGQAAGSGQRLTEGLEVYRRFVAGHRWMSRILWRVQALFIRVPPNVLALPASLLTRPGMLHPIMWQYYRLFDPAVLMSLRPGYDAADRWTGQTRGWASCQTRT